METQARSCPFHGSDFILPINPHFYLISVELGWEQGVGERSQQLA